MNLCLLLTDQKKTKNVMKHTCLRKCRHKYVSSHCPCNLSARNTSGETYLFPYSLDFSNFFSKHNTFWVETWKFSNTKGDKSKEIVILLQVIIYIRIQKLLVSFRRWETFGWIFSKFPFFFCGGISSPIETGALLKLPLQLRQKL